MIKLGLLLLSLCSSQWAIAEVIRSQYKDTLCLAVNDDPSAGWRLDRNVESMACEGDDHQQFTVVSIQLETGETVQKIQTLGHCLDIDSTETEPWTQNNNIVAAPCSESENQHFALIPQSEGWFSIQSRVDGRCLDIDLNNGNGWRTERNIHLWTCHGEPNQLWQVVPDSSESPQQN